MLQNYTIAWYISVYFGRFEWTPRENCMNTQFIHHQSEIIQQHLEIWLSTFRYMVSFVIRNFYAKLTIASPFIIIPTPYLKWTTKPIPIVYAKEWEKKLSFRKVFELSIKHLHWNNLQFFHAVTQMYAQNLCHSTFAIDNNQNKMYVKWRNSH